MADCSAGFVYSERGSSTKERWYACSYCKSVQIPPDLHVGSVYDDSVNVKSVEAWNIMSFPPVIQSLSNQYERGQVSICSLFLSTGMSHTQGKVSAIAKLDRHYYGLFGFLAIKDLDIWQHSPNPESSMRIKNAIRWLHKNNHLYSNFFAQYERHCKLKDMNTDVAGQQHPRPEVHQGLLDLCKAKYGEMYLDCKAFPHLHPWGHGGWYHRCPIPFKRPM